MEWENAKTMKMSDIEFDELCRILKGEFGIDMGKKKEIMKSRLETYLREEKIDSFREYINCLKNDATGKRKVDMANILSTNHTYFMRESEHFEFLRSEVLPMLKEKQKDEKDIDIWCGAASTGQEPYGIAMLMMEFFGIEHSMWDTKILATDISTSALQKATEGAYNEEQMKNVPQSWIRRFFKKDNNNIYHASDELKKEVIFRRFNLMDDFPFRRKMHINFFRNVMIYFDNETRQKLVNKIYNITHHGGYLFIGQTETLDRIDVPFRLLKPSIYIKD